jgi:hypothetical protein
LQAVAPLQPFKFETDSSELERKHKSKRSYHCHRCCEAAPMTLGQALAAKVRLIVG